MDFTLNLSDSSREPAYYQIAQQLTQLISSQNIPPNTKLPGITAIAALARVSIKTADLALNELLRRGICYRRPKKGTFVSKREISAKENIIKIVLLNDEATPVSDLTLGAINQFMIQYCIENRAELRYICDIQAEQKHQAGEYTASQKIYFFYGNQKNIPPSNIFPNKFILLNQHLSQHIHAPETDPRLVSAVVNDDFSGGYQLASAMLQAGARIFASILFISDAQKRRLDGFVSALKEKKITIDKNLIYSYDPQYIDRTEKNSIAAGSGSPQSIRSLGYQAMRSLLTVNPGIHAVSCTNDFLAAGAQEYVIEKDLCGQISVCGYDDIKPELSAGLSYNTVHIDYAAIVRTALKAAENPHRIPKIQLIHPQIILRCKRSQQK